MNVKLPERRRFIRLEVPLSVMVNGDGWSEEVVTKNISPIGMRFELLHKPATENVLDLTLFIPSSKEIRNVKCRVVWIRRASLEDNSPYDLGVEITYIEERSKNVLLKYLCDLLYESAYHAG